MKITENTPDRLVIEVLHWKAPLIYAGLALFSLVIGYRMVMNVDAGLLALLAWLGLTVGWLLPMAIWTGERGMLILDATKSEADFRHRDYKGLHQHRFDLAKVQSTRVTRWRRDGPAAKDPLRLLTLYVRDGMDEGRHKLTNRPVPAQDALEISALVSNWMKDWRNRA